MKEIVYGVKELQAHLSEALQAVQSGHRVVVSSRNRPVAELIRVRKGVKANSSLERRLDLLARQGKLIRATNRGFLAKYKPMNVGGVSDQLLADRR